MALGLIAVILTLVTAALAVLSALVAAHVARSAADLSALAAATALQQGSDPCVAARDIATRNRAHVVVCRVDASGIADVTVRSPVTLRLPGTPGHAQGRARAGPEGSG